MARKPASRAGRTHAAEAEDAMQKQEVPDTPVTEDLHPPQWEPPTAPTPGGREWFVLIIERFGFLIACFFTVAVLGILFVNSDLLLRSPDTAQDPPEAEAPGSPVEAQEPPPAVQALPVEAPDTAAVANAALSIDTNPDGAAIFVDGEFAGIAPVREMALAEGRHLISVQKPDYTQLDTFVTVAAPSMALALTLREAETVADAPEDPAETPPETVAASDEPEREVPPDRPPRQEEQPPRDAEDTNPARDLSDQEQLPVAEIEEPPPPQVGELQVVSEPAGATVTVDGQAVGVTPLVLTDVEAGSAQVRLSLEGHAPYETTITVMAQQRQTVSQELEALLGTLKILAKPWGNIYINGTLHKSEASIRYTTTVPPGNHRVRVEHPALGKWEQVVEVRAGEERAITVDFNKGNSPQ